MAGRSMGIDRQIIAALMFEPGLAVRLRDRLALPEHTQGAPAALGELRASEAS